MGKIKTKNQYEADERQRDKLTALKLLENKDYEKDLENLQCFARYIANEILCELTYLTESELDSLTKSQVDTEFSRRLHSSIEGFKKKYSIAYPYDINQLENVKDGKASLSSFERARIVGMVDHSIFRESCLDPDYYYVKIKRDAPKFQVIYLVDELLSCLKKDDPTIKNKRLRKEQIEAMEVWAEKRLDKTFKQISADQGISESAALKRMQKAHELIYGEKYNPADFEKPEIKKRHLKRECSTCKEHPDHGGTCSELCPDVMAFVEQDTKSYQRERPVANKTTDFIIAKKSSKSHISRAKKKSSD